MIKAIVLSMLVLSAGFPAFAQDLSAYRDIIQYEQVGENIYYSYKGEPAGNRTIISSTRESISPTQFRIYPQQKFYQEGGNWYTIERDISPAETFVKPPDLVSGYFVKKAFAASLPISNIDGYTRGSNATYATAGSSGVATNGQEFEIENMYTGGTYYRARRAFAFDATGLTISSSTLIFQVGSLKQNADSDSVSVVMFTPNSYSTLINADHTAFGTTKIASDVAFSALPSQGSWVGMPITDISGFNNVFGLGIRTSKDIAGTQPTGLTRVSISSAFLLVDTGGGGPTPTPGTTSTTTAADYERLSTFALTGAVSLLFFLVGFGLVVFIYKML